LAATLEEPRAAIPGFLSDIRHEALRPHVRLDAVNEPELCRPLDCVDPNSQLGTLLEDTLDLADAERAA
jgi:hypothetical protein